LIASGALIVTVCEITGEDWPSASNACAVNVTVCGPLSDVDFANRRPKPSPPPANANG